MSTLAWLGVVTAAAAFGAHRIHGEATFFVVANAATAVAAFGFAGLSRLRSAAAVAPDGAARAPLAEAMLRCVATLWAIWLLVSAVAWTGLRADLSFEREASLSPATIEAARALPELRITHFEEAGDPRLRRTRLLLEEIRSVAGSGARLRAQDLAQPSALADALGVAASNSVAVEHDGRAELVERPTEGALFEALSRLRSRDAAPILYWSVGAGEGDPARSDARGFSGLATALQTEGYRVRSLSPAFLDEIPADAAALIFVAPERALRPESLDALRHYLERGGRLLVFLEPGHQSGLETLLAEYGLASEDALLVDPASAPIEGEQPGLAPLAFAYAQHPATLGLDHNRMTFFRRARSFSLRKPRVEDRLRGVVLASGESWLLPSNASEETLSSLPEAPPGTRTDYHPLLATGQYRRVEGDTRIAAFGDSDFASNRYLRTLYNLDLAMNTVHWVTAREAKITLRPKGAGLVQFPVPVQNSLRAFYGVGMGVPELLLLIGGWVWLRGRAR